jgi:hypothetical protein
MHPNCAPFHRVDRRDGQIRGDCRRKAPILACFWAFFVAWRGQILSKSAVWDR